MDWDEAMSPYIAMFDAMCERFAFGYQPKDATEFNKELVARLTGGRRAVRRLKDYLRRGTQQAGGSKVSSNIFRK